MTHVSLKVWWIPQVPMKAFDTPVLTIEEGRKICDVLAAYDQFQYENRVKGDYCNVGGVSFSHPGIENGDCFDVPDDEDEFADWLKEIADADAAIDAKEQS